MSFQVANNLIDHVKKKELWQLLYDNHKKDDLIDMGDEFGIKTLTSWNKKNLAQSIEKYLTADPSHLTFRMPLKEIQDLQKLLRAGGVLPECDFGDTDILRFPNLYFRHVVEFITNDDKEYWVVPDNLRKALLSITNRLDDELILRQWDRREKIICGLTSLYGIMPLEDFVNLYNDINGEEDTLKPINLIHFIEQRDRAFVELNLFDYGEKEYVVSSRMERVENILSEILRRPKLSYHSFTREEVLEMGTLYYSFTSPSSKNLFNYLTTVFNVSAPVTSLLIREIGEMAQNNVSAPELIKKIFEALNQISDHKDDNPNRFLSILKNYLNNLPRWALKGNTLNEVMERNAYGQIYPQMETEEDMDEISYFSFVKPYSNFLKIENNDPCFCGSGKMYKDCCGDN
ncbi:hypothetical protein EZS27_009410 [termite gut metagenome]|uniref:Protein translocase subunit SecA n=1 Tax=termite gut metagenome TaxID=433724 RepID=A0A5J4S9T4_9ZZZZ